jgi:hypothetical protein
MELFILDRNERAAVEVQKILFGSPTCLERQRVMESIAQAPVAIGRPQARRNLGAL